MLLFFMGSIPVSLAKASKFQIVDFAIKGLTGSIAGDLERLQGLGRLNFDDNRLGRGDIDDLNFLIFLANCTSVEVLLGNLINLTFLGLEENYSSGSVPVVTGRLHKLGELHMYYNNFSRENSKIFGKSERFGSHGNIPAAIGNLVNLTLLGLEENYSSGSVPVVTGRLHKIGELHMYYNNFSGSIPSSFGNLTSLTTFFMQRNKFVGSIPPSLGNCQKLQILNLSRKNLDGTIPEQVLGPSSLSVSLAMSHKFFTGSLPLEVDNLKNLNELDFSGNKLKFSSQIPSSLGSCTSLAYLHLGSNTFEGKIPKSLENLRGLEELDFSSKNLTGQIPKFLSKLVSLRHLDLSFNELDGEVSREGIFANASAIFLIGNDKLCGGVSELLLPVCSRKKPRKLLTPNVIRVIIAVTLALLMLCSFGIYLRVKNSRRHSTALFSSDGQPSLSYSDISKSTNNFSEENTRLKKP
ncbi:hypothetical protein Dsin_006027 [Dipteronia sinensis]|uniref:Disease resistance R13L4/SHOC-2-like LRR domain-containing protein n=1 Tax=Dipteronia sinensis TaxID=43782 RepID=A0AAE0EH15_9ROSI|nr:hypothetical protein Dsin_006027 [Dipteronia sinensis]